MSLKAMITGRLDKVATYLQNKGEKKAAAALDQVTNTLASVRVAVVPETSNNPDENPAVPAQDVFLAKDYHKLPVGADNVGSEVFDKKNANDYSPTFASEATVNVQASNRGRQAENVDLQDMTDKHLDPDIYDLGNATDDFSTGALPQSGHDPAVDDDQEGGSLEAFGTQPEGALHASRKLLQAAVNSGTFTSKQAQQIFAGLKQAAGEVQNADVHTEQPAAEEAGITDKGAAIASKIAAACPPPAAIVPPALSHVWVRAAVNTHKAGKLVLANRKINTAEVVKAYRTMLRDFADLATV